MSSQHDTPPRRRNLIWFFGDQHRAASLGCAGDPNVRTPHLDRFAAEGVRFNGVAGCPLCTPYRGSLLSGRYPHHAAAGHEYPLDPRLPTIAQPFNDAGYHTAYLGKWHLDGYQSRRDTPPPVLHTVPRDRRGGFKHWLGYENNNSQWRTQLHGHGDDGQEVKRFQLDTYETDALTSLAIDYVQRRAEDRVPFFLAVSVQPPHDPYVAPAEEMARHNPGRVELRANVPPVPRVVERARRDLAGYHAMIENLDRNFGRLRGALDQLALADDTLICFFSDHGDMHGSHGQFLKATAYEEAIRVPCIIGGLAPQYDHPNAVRPDVLVNHVDLAPTSLGLCGLTPPDWMQGQSVAPLYFKGQPEPALPDSAYLQMVVPTRHPDSVDRPWRGVVTRDGWKYVCMEHQPWLMFNLNEDPFELANLAFNTRFRSQRQRLHATLNDWITRTGDDFALGHSS